MCRWSLEEVWLYISGLIVFHASTPSSPSPELSLISLHWFLTAFASVVHMKVLLRIWDLFFYEGSMVLFQMTLGMLKMKVWKIRCNKIWLRNFPDIGPRVRPKKLLWVRCKKFHIANQWIMPGDVCIGHLLGMMAPSFNHHVNTQG